MHRQIVMKVQVKSFDSNATDYHSDGLLTIDLVMLCPIEKQEH